MTGADLFRSVTLPTSEVGRFKTTVSSGLCTGKAFPGLFVAALAA